MTNTTSLAVALSGGLIAGAGALAHSFVQPGGSGNPMVQAALGSHDVTVNGAVSLSSLLNAFADATARGVVLGLGSGGRSAGKFAWIGGGRHLTSTTHIDNVVEGLVLAAERGVSGGVYFVTDGEPVEFRDFVTRWLATAGVEPGKRNVPAPLARVLAGAGERTWRALRLKGQPPVTRLAVWLSSLETTIDISRAREELGYTPLRGIDEGLAELAAQGVRA